MIKKLTIIFGIISITCIVIYAVVSLSQEKISPSFITFPFSKVQKIEYVEPTQQEILHVAKPLNVKGAYMSSWVAGTTSIRNRLVSLVNETELNSLVIDFKDSTGVVSTKAGDGASKDRINAGSRRAQDLPEFIKELHKHNIYVIARIAVFEDPVYSKNNFDQAVQTSMGSIWVDRHNLSWVDPASTQFHEYIMDLCLEAYDMGFDEINLDYIRYPTDGAKDKVFPVTGETLHQSNITNFVKFIHNGLKQKNIPLSIDVFGQIVSTSDDMGIGQYYEDLLLSTDTISPMVYPSHFYPGYKNLASPESTPYETIRLSMSDAIRRKNSISASTEIRPWLQDFSLAVNYDKEKVQAQIKAAHDLGINSYLLWDPKNIYTKEALNLETQN